MNEESICRVLIVDDELEYAAQTASKLEEIRPSLLNHNRLQIELTNNAYFAAERLRQCAAGQPPWDIIIAEVYMPFPSRLPKKDIVDCDAVSGKFRHLEKIWPCWQYTYSGSAAPEEKVDHGGFQIGEAIAKRLTAGELMSDLKLILMSDCLFGEERERVLAYQGTNNAWVKYYDKADWRRDRLSIADGPVIDAKVIPTWPVSQLEPDVFQWALILAIAERKWKYWGDSIYKQIPGSDAVFVGATITAQMESTATEARRVGANDEIETVLITGERGTGREVFARLVHQVRMASLGAEGEFVGIDCSSITGREFEKQLFDQAEDAAGGTLFIDEVDKLTPYHQGWLYHLLKDKKIRGGDRMNPLDFSARLAICTASGRNLEELNHTGLFHDDLYFLLKDEQLHIKPLRERPADAVSLAEVLAKNADIGLTLSDDARHWIEMYSWPGNTRELMNVIRVAVRKNPTSSLRAEDLKRVVETSPTIPTTVPSDEIIAKNDDDGVREFRAEPPFQLLWDESVLIDAKKRKIPIAYDLHSVLKGLLQKESGQHGLIKSKLTFAEIAALYKGGSENVEEQEIAHKFAHNLRRFLDNYGIHHGWLLKTWKGYGYRVGQYWDNPPYVYASEAPLVFTNDIEKAERLRREKEIGRKKKASPEY